MTDPVLSLQAAARRAAAHICPGTLVVRVVLFSSDGAKILDLAVPAGNVSTGDSEERPCPLGGWSFTDSGVRFDGRPVRVSGSRIGLLKVLAEAHDPVPAKELIGVAFDSHTSEVNVRFHVKELRRELKAAFPDFDDDLISAEGDGYLLMVR